MDVVINVVVFDLDGTLVDSRRDLADATNALTVELGGRVLSEERVTAMVGDGAAMLIRRALTAASLDPNTPGVLDRFLVHYDARLLDHTRPYPGMVETLAALSRRVRLAVLTNKPSAATERLLAGLDLRSHFADVVGGDTNEGRKPDPNGLIGIIQRASATPGETLLVGDSAIDLATGRRAGAHICLTRYGFGFPSVVTPLDDDVAVIDSPGDLVPLLDALNSLEPRQV